MISTPASNFLTPAHQLLQAVCGQPVASQAWLDQGLAHAGVDGDGHTDLTALFLPELQKAKDTWMVREEWPANLVTLAQRLVTHGCSPFQQNSDGMDAFDLTAWRRSYEWTDTLFQQPDRPEVNALLGRTPRAIAGGPGRMRKPTLWAMWALDNRGDELILAHENGGTWPQDILGWAHPDLMDDLVRFHEAPWSDQVVPLWQERVRTGELSAKDVNAMRAACLKQFGDVVNAVPSGAIRNAQDLITLINRTKNVDNWAHARAQFGDMGSLTVSYTDGQKKRSEWPIFARLLGLISSETFSREKQKGLLRFLTQDFHHLTGNPEQKVGIGPHMIGTLAHVVLAHLRHNTVRNEHQLAPLQTLVDAWVGPVNWAQALACADATGRHELFAKQPDGGLVKGLNTELFIQANLLAQGQPQALTPAQNSLLEMAITRAIDSYSCVGFLDRDVARFLMRDKPDNLVGDGPFEAILRKMSPFQRLHAVLAGRSQEAFDLGSLENNLRLLLELPHSDKENQALVPTLRAFKQHAFYGSLADRLEAEIRADRAGSTPEASAHATRARMRP